MKKDSHFFVITQQFKVFESRFNPSTKIKFSVPSLPLMKGVGGMAVVLKIYDILGREISTLVNEQLKPGTYEVPWEAASKYPSGIYLYRIFVDGQEMAKKMVLMK